MTDYHEWQGASSAKCIRRRILKRSGLVRATLLAVVGLILGSCSYSTPLAPLPTATAPASPTAAPTKTPFPPTSTPTEVPRAMEYPVEFPISPLSQSQILEVAACRIEDLAATRYPKSTDRGNLSNAFSPQSNCDWAVLAYAYGARNQRDAPDAAGVEALSRAVSGNYGYALATPLYYQYAGSLHLVKNLEMGSKEITKVDISYDWWGLGRPPMVQFALSIDKANRDPVAISRSGPRPKNVHLTTAPVQELSQALDDLLPIDNRIQIVACTDNYPTWHLTLYFDDGSKIDVESASNVFGLGGPWETEIDGQVYIQYGAHFAEKLYGLVQALGLQLGSPDAWTCFPDPIFEKAFSQHLPTTETPTPDPKVEALWTEFVQTLSAESTQYALQTPTP